MENLKKHSIRIDGNIIVFWPQKNSEEDIDMSDIGSKFNGAYCVNNSTIGYIVCNEVFVAPYTKKAIEVLKNAGLTEGAFYVPFSNGDFPKQEQAKWSSLRELAREASYRDYEVDCIEWCNSHNIGELEPELLANCFRIPRDGVSVKHPFYEGVCYPVCNEQCMDSTVTDKLGCFYCNNGIVAFVYRDGHTYVTKGYWVVECLLAAGYRERGIFVPFSNGEQIADPGLADAWSRIVKKRKR